VSDEDELQRARDGDADAFAAFYRRHVGALLGYFMRRTRDAEQSADLCAETFAAALVGLHRFDPERGPAVAWLFGIARRKLGQALAQGAVEDRARRRLGMARLEPTDEAIERIETVAALESTARALRAALEGLPGDQRAAVEARVVDERDYAQIAAVERTSESTVRKRVSRGLAGLRARMDREKMP